MESRGGSRLPCRSLKAMSFTSMLPGAAGAGAGGAAGAGAGGGRNGMNPLFEWLLPPHADKVARTTPARARCFNDACMSLSSLDGMQRMLDMADDVAMTAPRRKRDQGRGTTRMATPGPKAR